MEQQSLGSARAKQGTDATVGERRELWWAEASIWTDRMVSALGRACPCEGGGRQRRQMVQPDRQGRSTDHSGGRVASCRAKQRGGRRGWPECRAVRLPVGAV